MSDTNPVPGFLSARTHQALTAVAMSAALERAMEPLGQDDPEFRRLDDEQGTVGVALEALDRLLHDAMETAGVAAFVAHGHLVVNTAHAIDSELPEHLEQIAIIPMERVVGLGDLPDPEPADGADDVINAAVPTLSFKERVVVDLIRSLELDPGEAIRRLAAPYDKPAAGAGHAESR